MSTQGFHVTSMAQIIKEASVGAGTLYHYFDSKESLMNQCVVEIKKELAIAVSAKYDAEASYETNFKTMWHAIWEHTFTNQKRAYFGELFIRSPLITQETYEEIYKDFATPLAFLQESMDNGNIDETGLSVLESFIFGPIYHLLKLSLSRQVEEPELYREKMYLMCFNSMKLTK